MEKNLREFSIPMMYRNNFGFCGSFFFLNSGGSENVDVEKSSHPNLNICYNKKKGKQICNCSVNCPIFAVIFIYTGSRSKCIKICVCTAAAAIFKVSQVLKKSPNRFLRFFTFLSGLFVLQQTTNENHTANIFNVYFMTLAHDVYRVMHLAKKEYFFNIIQLRDRQKTNFLKFQNDGKFCALFRKPKNAFDKLLLDE